MIPHRSGGFGIASGCGAVAGRVASVAVGLGVAALAAWRLGRYRGADVGAAARLVPSAAALAVVGAAWPGLNGC